MSTRAGAATIRAVGASHMHTCPPTCAQLQLRVPTLPFAHPLPLRVSQMPPAQLSRVPRAVQPSTARPHSTGYHEQLGAPPSPQDPPCTLSEEVTPQPQPPPDPGDPAQCSCFSDSARLLEPVFYGLLNTCGSMPVRILFGFGVIKVN